MAKTTLGLGYKGGRSIFFILVPHQGWGRRRGRPFFVVALFFTHQTGVWCTEKCPALRLTTQGEEVLVVQPHKSQKTHRFIFFFFPFF